MLSSPSGVGRVLLISALLVATGWGGTQPGSSGVGRWSYADGEYGPESWGAVTREGSSALAFPGCRAIAGQQSPINIDGSNAEIDGALDAVDFSGFSAPGAKVNVTNDGRVLSLTAAGTVASAVWNGEGFALVSAEVHVPAEHALASSHHDMELHLFLTADTDGRWLKIVTLWRAALYGTHEALQRLFVDVTLPSAPTRLEGAAPPLFPTVNVSTSLLDVSWRSLVPAAADYHTYEGTWSTPPCSPATVLVMDRVMTASLAQVDAVYQALRGALVPAGNTRPAVAANQLIRRYVAGASAQGWSTAGQRADEHDVQLLAAGRLNLGVPIAALVVGGLSAMVLTAVLALGPEQKVPHRADADTTGPGHSKHSSA
jgi:carbonic anhydrase